MAPGPGHFPRQMCAKVPPKVLWSAAAGDTLGAAPPPFPVGGWGAGRGASQWPARLRRAAASRCRWGCASREPGELSLSCRGARTMGRGSALSRRAGLPRARRAERLGGVAAATTRATGPGQTKGGCGRPRVRKLGAGGGRPGAAPRLGAHCLPRARPHALNKKLTHPASAYRPINSQTNSRLIVHRVASEWEDQAQEFSLWPILDGPLFVLTLPSVIYSSHATVSELLKILLPLPPRPPFLEDGLYI